VSQAIVFESAELWNLLLVLYQMFLKQLGIGLQNPLSAIGVRWMILPLNTFAIYIGLSIDKGINSRPPFWISRWLGSRH
jgi:hypothetical protein